MLLLAAADLEQQIASLATKTVAYAAVALVVLVVLAVIVNRQSEKLQRYLKLPLFVMIAFTMLGSTLLLAGSTIYLNVKSDSGGPVHWHSGIEFWACGTELNLRDPSGLLSNKVGSPTYHEHNDKYMHLEGVVVERDYDASLEKFMSVTGGYVTDQSVGIPLSEDAAAWELMHDQKDGDQVRFTDGASIEEITANGQRISDTADGPVLQLKNGDDCGSVPDAELQVFVYSYDKASETYSQRKLENPGAYIMRDESALGPPGDCVIVEFDTPKAATDKLCEQYGIKDSERCTEFGVEAYDPGLCNLREVSRPVEQPTSPPANETGGATETESLCAAGDDSSEPCDDIVNEIEDPCRFGGDNPDAPECDDTAAPPQTPVDSTTEESAGTVIEEGGTE